MTSLSHIDHIVYGCHDLDEGIDHIEQLTGVRAEPGGAHGGFGTHNALLSLENGIYLEIIAPDPHQPDHDGPRPFGLNDLDRPRLIGWVAHASDIGARVTQARDAGYDPGDIVEASRTKPDGSRVTWRLTVGTPLYTGGALPFLIDWGAGQNPSATAPNGCELQSFTIRHTNPAEVNDALSALRLDLRADKGDRFQLRAVIRSPKGEVALT